MIDAIRKSTKRLKTFRKQIKAKTKELRAKIKRRMTSATVIAVTGSSGKTTTVSLLAHILEGETKVASQFLGNGYSQAVTVLGGIKADDRFVVMEQGTDGPGTLPRVAKLIKPDVAIVTLVAIEHYTAFRTIEAVAKEKAAFIEKLPPHGLAILNFDDPKTRAMAEMTCARSVTFGTTGGDYRVVDIATCSEAHLAFTLTHGDLRLPLQTKLLGQYNWLSIAAAAACALELGISPATVASRVASFLPVQGRMSSRTLEDGVRFILDTAKAPYHSILLPLETLETIAAPKKRFILGQISDYSGNATKKYKDTYAAAAKVADEIYFVGPWGHKARAPAQDVESGKFRAFATVQALSDHLKQTAEEGEVIVVKSARNLHLERLLLDRIGEVRCWANECGNKGSCEECGLYEREFYEHNGRRTKRKA